MEKNKNDSDVGIYVFILFIGTLLIGFTITLLPIIVSIWGLFISKSNRFWNGIGILLSELYVFFDLKQKWILYIYMHNIMSSDDPPLKWFDKGYINIIYTICFLIAILFIIQSYRERRS